MSDQPETNKIEIVSQVVLTLITGRTDGLGQVRKMLVQAVLPVCVSDKLKPSMILGIPTTYLLLTYKRLTHQDLNGIPPPPSPPIFYKLRQWIYNLKTSMGMHPCAPLFPPPNANKLTI